MDKENRKGIFGLIGLLLGVILLRFESLWIASAGICLSFISWFIMLREWRKSKKVEEESERRLRIGWL